MGNRIRVLLLFVGLFLGQWCFPVPVNPGHYVVVEGGIVDIPAGSVVEGSARFGGIQPDYYIDLTAPGMQRILHYGRKIGKSDLSLWEKIERIEKYVRRSVLPNRDYDDPDYTRLAARYRERGQDVPIDEYITHRAGVCREHALVTHFILKAAGIDNFHVYAQIHRRSHSQDFDIVEDHAFTVILVENDYWVVDSYYWGFNGFRLKDLLSAHGIRANSRSAPIATPAPGFRRIIAINSFPRIWIPKSNSSIRLIPLSEPGTPLLPPVESPIPDCSSTFAAMAS